MTYQEVAEYFGLDNEQELFEDLSNETNYYIKEYGMSFEDAYDFVTFLWLNPEA